MAGSSSSKASRKPLTETTKNKERKLSQLRDRMRQDPTRSTKSPSTTTTTTSGGRSNAQQGR